MGSGVYLVGVKLGRSLGGIRTTLVVVRGVRRANDGWLVWWCRSASRTGWVGREMKTTMCSDSST